MKRSGIIIILLILAAAGFGSWWFFFREKEKPVALETEHPERGHIALSVTATGTIQPVDTVSVGSQVSGTIKKVLADFNSKVKKGQLIAQLDQSLLGAQVDQYKANLEVAKSQEVFQKSVYDRQNKLYNTGAISRADYDNATYQYNAARANVLSVQAQLEAASRNLSYTNIYSPVDGVVMDRNVSVGQTVASSFNTPTLFIIAKDISKMQVQAAVDEADIGNVRVGQRATFTVDAFPDNQFTGTVEEIRLQPTVSANVVTYVTIIKAPNENLRLKPGMTANIIIYTKETDSALLIPAKAIKFKPDASAAKQFKISAPETDTAQHRERTDSGRHRISDSTVEIKPKRASVWVVKGDSLIQKRILTGMNDDARIQVLRGLTEDDEIVTGMETAEAADQTNNAAGGTRSPFMPRRRSSNASSGSRR